MEALGMETFEPWGHRWYAARVGGYSISLSRIGDRWYWHVLHNGQWAAEGIECCRLRAEGVALRCVSQAENSPDADIAEAGESIVNRILSHELSGCDQSPE
jgi:hypothetical protein